VRWSWLRVVGASFAVVVIGAACSEGDVLVSPPTSAADGGEVASADGPCRGAAGDSAGTELLGCVGPSVVFVETYAGSGSGLLLADGYVVTNAHVVDPFSAVTLTFEDGEMHEAVPVVGTDLVSDIAVLGPIDTDHAALALQDPTDNVKGGDVFLVGFPSETANSAPELTISRGVLSRFREVDVFDMTFLQTDAAIGSGQSGGALVDPTGRVIGVSGLFYDEFAYALAGPEVQASVDRIRGGEVSEYRSLPIAESSTTSSVHVETPEVDEGWVVLPYSDTDATVRVTVRSDATTIFVVADMFLGEPTFVSASAFELYGIEADTTFDGAREVEPGVYEVDVPADTYLIGVFGAVTPADVFFESSVPVHPVPDGDQGTVLAAGTEIDGVIDYFESNDSFLLDLVEGQEVTISVRSPTGDMAYTVQAPGQPFADVDFIDDSNIGLLGFDAEERYVATTTGIHVLRVVTNDGLSTGYRLEITAG
jgi:hypothetical protein